MLLKNLKQLKEYNNLKNTQILKLKKQVKNQFKYWIDFKRLCTIL